MDQADQAGVRGGGGGGGGGSADPPDPPPGYGPGDVTLSQCSQGDLSSVSRSVMMSCSPVATVHC